MRRLRLAWNRAVLIRALRRALRAADRDVHETAHLFAAMTILDTSQCEHGQCSLRPDRGKRRRVGRWQERAVEQAERP